MLAYAGAAFATVVVVLQPVSALLLYLERSSLTPARTAAARQILGAATNWSNETAVLLFVVLGLAWATANRWSTVIVLMDSEDSSDADWQETIASSGSEPEDEDESEPEAEDWEDEAETPTFHEATRHLARIRPLVAWTAILLIVVFAAGVARVVGSFIQPQPPYTGNFAGTLVYEVSTFLTAAIAAVVGLAAAARITRICLWWEYV